jgi:hypothetical protein
MAGMVLGTPGYLSPEQARGLPVDERADVYALGATLYHVLSGRAPVVGDHLHDVLERTGRGDILPLLEAAPGLPSDLCAIVQKALSLAPGDRYPTARELAEDLRRFQTGRLVGAHAYRPRELVRRWLERHRAVVAVSGAALVILIVAGVLALRSVVAARDQAERERSRAVKQRDAAEVLVDFMLGDLKERLEQVGRLALLEGVGAEVDLYYHRIAPNPDRLDAPGRARQARARRILAQVLGERGEVTRALEHLSRVRRVEEALLARRPGVAAHGNLAQTLLLVGTLALRAGQKEAAQQALAEAVRLAREALRLEPGSDRWRTLAIQALLARIRQLLHASDLGPALQAGREALALAEAQRAGSAHRDEAMGDVHGALSATLALKGELDAALLSAEASVAALDRVRVLDPGNARLERRVRSALYSLCQAAVEAGAASRAEGPCRRLSELTAQLLDRDPTSAQGRREHALSQYWASWAEHLLGRSDQALTRAEAARAALLGLVAKDRRDVEFAQNAASATQHLADLRLDRGEAPLARSLAGEILADLRALSARSPDLFRWAEATLGARAVLAAAWLAGGDPARAQVEATVALTEASRAPQELARSTDGARSLVLAAVTAARAHLARGDLALAEQRAREAIATSRRAPLALRSRLEPEGQAALAEVLARKGDAAGALAAARDRAHLARGNRERFPGNVPEQLAAARALAAVASLERQRPGGALAARAATREAAALLERAAGTQGLHLSPADQALLGALRRAPP